MQLIFMALVLVVPVFFLVMIGFGLFSLAFNYEYMADEKLIIRLLVERSFDSDKIKQILGFYL